MTPHHPVSRRRFLGLAGGALGLSALPPISRAQRAPDSPAVDGGVYPPRRFTIDAHVHYRNTPEYLPSLVRHYRERNAMACVIASSLPDFAKVLQASKDFPDVVIPFVRIVPDEPNALANLDTVAAQGAKGISELSSFRYDWDDERYFPFYEKMQAKGLVALFHSMGTGVRTRPEHLLPVAAKFTQLQIICAHMGHPDYGIAAEIARLRSNVVVEISGSMLLKFQSFPAKLKEFLWWEGPNPHSPVGTGYAFEKLVFATDEPPDHLPKCISQYETILQACSVPEATRRNIYGGTMAKILGIPVRT